MVEKNKIKKNELQINVQILRDFSIKFGLELVINEKYFNCLNIWLYNYIIQRDNNGQQNEQKTNLQNLTSSFTHPII